MRNQTTCTSIKSFPCRSELSMGPVWVTRINPTHQLTDPTRPSTSGTILTEPSTADKFNCLVQTHLIKPCFKCTHIILSKFWHFCCSGPDPTHQKLKNLHVTRSNPTQAMDSSGVPIEIVNEICCFWDGVYTTVVSAATFHWKLTPRRRNVISATGQM